MSEPKPKSYRWVVALLLALVTLAVYWPVRHHDFIDLDDRDYVTANPDIRAGLSWEGVHWAFTKAFSSNWHPLTWMSHMLDCQLFGVQAGPPHLENVAFHVVNTLLLLFLLARWTGAFWRSLLVAGLFALHPLHVESVAWVAERKDVLSTCFFLLTLWAYTRYAQGRSSVERRASSAKPAAPALGSRRSALDYSLALFFFALGLMSKPMLVTLPFVLLLLDFWPLQRLPLAPQSLVASLRPLLLEKLPFLGLSALSSILTVWAQGQGKSIATFTALPLEYRLANSLVSYLKYVAKTLWPSRLAIFYPFPRELETGWLIGAVVLLLGVSALAWHWRRRRPYFALGWLWFLGTLVPVIGLVQVGNQSLADRYTYIPSIGLFVALVWLVADLAGALPRRTLWLGSAAAASLGLCATLTCVQLQTWRNTQTVFEHAHQVTTKNFLALIVLGDAMGREGKVQAAMDNFNEAIQYAPDYPGAWIGLGTSLFSLGKKSEGLDCFKHAVDLLPTDPEILCNYAIMLVLANDPAQAEQLLRRAIELRPKYPEPHIHLGQLLQRQGKFDEAEAHFQEALRLKPESGFGHCCYAESLARQKKFPAAVAEYRTALSLQPKLVEAQLGLAAALAETGDLAHAAEGFSTVLTAYPTNATALDGLGYTLAVRNRPEEAYPYFEKALSLAPTNASVHLHLAMECQRRGQKQQAFEHYRRAIQYGPELILARNNLAWSLATDPDPHFRNGAEAVQVAEPACQATGRQEPLFLGTLAAAYAEAGRFPEAVQTAESARDLAAKLGMQEVADRNSRLLEYYRAGKAFHETTP